MLNFFYHTIRLRCRKHCAAFNHTYYALIWGDQCCCGNDPPKEEFKKEESHCYKNCPGEPSEMCGGSNNKVNVYKRQDKNPIADAIDLLGGGGFIVLMTAAGTAAQTLLDGEIEGKIKSSGVRIATIMVG